ncbi:MAG: nitroreductase family deazaflavin-dependent oxidoreductase [Candidatus Helarchaeales archaeon]
MEPLPRKGSALYNLIHPDPEKQQKALKKWKKMNKYLMIPFYRVGLLPLFGMGWIFLLLKTKGRKTGKIRWTPVEYHRIDGVIHVFASRGDKADWFKNMKANPDDVKVRHGFHWFKPRIEVVEDLDEKIKIFEWYVTKHPKAAKMLFGWLPKKDTIETTDLSPIAKMVKIIRLHKED